MASQLNLPTNSRQSRFQTGMRQAMPSGGRSAYAVLPLVLITYLTLLPPQVALSPAGFVLPFYRIGLIAVIPLVLFGWVKSGRKFSAFDGVVVLAALYIFVALADTEGIDRALQNGGSSALDVSISYFLARYCVQTSDDVRRFLILVAPGFFVAAATVTFEMLAGRYLVQPLAVQIFGQAAEGDLAISSPRFGLTRGTGMFPHPILAGLHLASLLSLYALSRLRGWPMWIGIAAALSAMATLSSAALIMLSASTGALLYNWISRKYPQLSWRLLITFIAISFLALEFASNRGSIQVIMTLTALDPWTAYYRTLIWDYGILNVRAHPWFGIGFADWDRAAWMPSSIDNYWLMIAIRYGLPEAILRLTIPVGVSIVLFLQSSALDPREQSLARGVAISLLFFSILGFSVALWNNTQAWFNILSGIAVSLSVLLARRRKAGVEA
ncbi:O-antigen ligase family protein [Aurantiacibacter sp. MUD11]|uniref:O-antigen ligase family protein n=1 Tax=Aurantiacibacter sp. MUD11 TaxID=3003265 RepID=UPI0022AA36BD|nr:O-antigen ligase family protein [Aurantiacibacter sp. MUD11]WAT17037.1 O-antigen ligase family protein [Aurantiacibacter sp. MUD11]